MKKWLNCRISRVSRIWSCTPALQFLWQLIVPIAPYFLYSDFPFPHTLPQFYFGIIIAKCLYALLKSYRSLYKSPIRETYLHPPVEGGCFYVGIKTYGTVLEQPGTRLLDLLAPRKNVISWQIKSALLREFIKSTAGWREGKLPISIMTIVEKQTLVVRRCQYREKMTIWIPIRTFCAATGVVMKNYVIDFPWQSQHRGGMQAKPW